MEIKGGKEFHQKWSKMSVALFPPIPYLTFGSYDSFPPILLRTLRKILFFRKFASDLFFLLPFIYMYMTCYRLCH